MTPNNVKKLEKLMIRNLRNLKVIITSSQKIMGVIVSSSLFYCIGIFEFYCDSWAYFQPLHDDKLTKQSS